VVGLTVVGIAGSVAATLLSHPSNSVSTPVAVGPNVQSSALYCTGLTNAAGGLHGVVAFVNTTSHPRHVIARVTATGAKTANSTTFVLGAHGRFLLQPDALVHGTTYAVAAQILGGGVDAGEVVTTEGVSAPCSSAGTTSWYGAGFDTTVGSKALLVIYNPTATASVFNIFTFSNAGYQAPAPLQGITVGPHAVITVNLGTYVVATGNVGVQVQVLRGSLVVAGDQLSGSVASMLSGSGHLDTRAPFALVTVARGAHTQIRISNPNPAPVSVGVTIHQSGFSLAPQTVAVPAFGTAKVVLAPNTAIAPTGLVSVVGNSTAPVSWSLSTGTSHGLLVSGLPLPGKEDVLSDVTGQGYSAAMIMNDSSTSERVGWRLFRAGRVVRSGYWNLPARSTQSLGQLLGRRSELTNASLVVEASRPVIAMTATLPSHPLGIAVVNSLHRG
jgi:hypothetical protein